MFAEPFTAFNLDAQLDLVGTQWVNKGDLTYKDGWSTARLVFDWYKEDFPCDQSQAMPTYNTKEYCSVLQFIAKYSLEYRKHIGKYYHTLSFETRLGFNQKPWSKSFSDNVAE